MSPADRAQQIRPLTRRAAEYLARLYYQSSWNSTCDSFRSASRAKVDESRGYCAMPQLPLKDKPHHCRAHWHPPVVSDVSSISNVPMVSGEIIADPFYGFPVGSNYGKVCLGPRSRSCRPCLSTQYILAMPKCRRRLVMLGCNCLRSSCCMSGMIAMSDSPQSRR